MITVGIEPGTFQMLGQYKDNQSSEEGSRVNSERSCVSIRYTSDSVHCPAQSTFNDAFFTTNLTQLCYSQTIALNR